MDVVKIENVDDMGKYKEDWEELQKSLSFLDGVKVHRYGGL